VHAHAHVAGTVLGAVEHFELLFDAARDDAPQRVPVVVAKQRVPGSASRID
jgi:hypothetical protein